MKKQKWIFFSTITMMFLISACSNGPSKNKITFVPIPDPNPSAVQYLAAVPQSTSSISLSWLSSSSYYEDGFRIYYSTANVKPSVATTEVAAGATSCLIPGLTANQTYHFWVSTFNNSGSVDAYTSQFIPVAGTPNGPTSLKVALATNTCLRWTDNANNETGYYIFWSTTGVKPRSPQATLGANATSYNLSAFTPGSYYFWVQPYNGAGNGSFVTGQFDVRNWTLAWSDEFNGAANSQPSSADWTWETGASGWGNNEWENYVTSANNSYEDGTGNLIIKAIKTTGGAGGYTSARMKTQGKRYWKYGRVEARMKLPYRKGIWPAFWMMPNSSVYGGWPNSGEMDIMESIGSTTIYGTVHRGAGSGANGDGASHVDATVSSTFHVLAVEWDADKIIWYFDNIPYHQYNRADGSGTAWWPFDQNFYIILNLAVGGQWPGYPDGTTVFPQVYTLDYVRVYQ